jgi:DNA-binding transcriptional ArsR family regulator
MVVDLIDEERANELFHALADATRRDIVRRAMRGDHSVSALAGAYPMSFAAVQKHVAVLERAGLVTKHRSGRQQLVQTDIEAIRRANQLLEELEAIWRSRIDRIDAMLADPEPGE